MGGGGTYNKIFDADVSRMRERSAAKLAREFATRAEAGEWLARGTAIHTERLKGFMVVQLPGRQTLIEAALPEELGADEEPQ